jgi:hypothetical protein
MDLLSALQVVYAVANEGSRLEIPEGPLGRLISGTIVIAKNLKQSKEVKTFDLASLIFYS